MPEPTSTTAAATLAATSLTMPVLTLFGVPLGLRTGEVSLPTRGVAIDA